MAGFYYLRIAVIDSFPGATLSFLPLFRKFKDEQRIL